MDAFWLSTLPTTLWISMIVPAGVSWLHCLYIRAMLLRRPLQLPCAGHPMDHSCSSRAYPGALYHSGALNNYRRNHTGWRSFAGHPRGVPHRRHVKGVGATFMALGGRDGLAWDTSPPPRDESRNYAVISFC